MTAPGRTIVLGYGNPGRLDDGLGPAFVSQVALLRLPNVAADADYQLHVEDAARIAEYETAIFADASTAGSEPFFCREVRSRKTAAFSSHHLAPEEVLHLAQSLFGSGVRAYVIGIRGYAFNAFEERLSERAAANLIEAVAFFSKAAAENRYPAIGFEGSADDGTPR